MIRLPQQLQVNSPLNRSWIQPNRGDSFGSLEGSFNLDLTIIPGKIRATRTLKTTDSASDTDLVGVPVGFKYLDGKIWTVAGTKVHSNNGTTVGAFTVDASGGTSPNGDVLSSVSDMELFNGSLYITSNSVQVYKKLSAAGNWTQIFTLPNSGTPHMMCAFANRLYFSDLLYRIVSSNTSDSLASIGSANTITLPSDTVITFLRPASNRIWIGTINTSGQKAFIYEWDGAAGNFTKAYRLDSNGVVSGVIKDDILYAMDVNGKLLVYSNSTFKEVARLPIREYKYLGNPTATTNIRYIHPNGMTISGGRINVLINNVINDSGSTINEFLPSGIWEYDENIGLYHKYSLSYTPGGSTTVTDYGQNRISLAGALSDLKIPSTSSTATGTFLAGATIFSNGSSTLPGIFTNDTIESLSGASQSTQKSCYLVTSKLQSSSIEDSWRKIFLRYKQMLASSNSIILKYRTMVIDPTEISITWTSTTTCTTTTNVLGLEGYEFEGIQGTGSGKTAHISQIDVTDSTYTIHLDDTFTGVTTGTGKARLQNWKKIPTTVTDQVSMVKDIGIGKVSSWIQFKICAILTTKDEIEEVIIVNEPFQNIA